ncbi:ABC transporter permease [Sediminitomix flava]|uniref:Putative ABC transport system permease protein n=1 Tax=Sediminitomix flava TaxID=379075 RepID=A0A315Z0E6_SEDFL|nr:ABC transporter permease [Sediminitomix flava]PWJ36022.1 putative ABC transport system permease protein [Sediminitomix flava]
MWKNYLKITVRHLLKHKFYTFINVFGLSVGLSVCLMIFFYVQDELSYDRHHENVDQIYRVYGDLTFNESRFEGPITPYPVVQSYLDNFNEFEAGVRLKHYGEELIQYNNKTLKIDEIMRTEPSIFDVFTIPFIKGDPKTALQDETSIVLDEDHATKIFGDEDPIGKTILFENKKAYTVRGVMKNLPSNSHLEFKAMVLMVAKDNFNYRSWLSNNYYSYFKVKEGVDIEELGDRISMHSVEKMLPEIEQFLGKAAADPVLMRQSVHYSLQKLVDIHLYSHSDSEMSNNGNISYVYIFSAIAFFILLIACINYINLATARSADRAKEVGIRKVLGAARKQVIKQFLSESFLLAVIAMIFALLIVENTLPYFNTLAGKELDPSYFGNLPVFIVLIGFILFVGVLAGSYPALFLSSFVPSKVLKGSLRTGMKGGSLRSILVIGQFAISTFLIAATLIIFKQLNYIQNKELGYDREHIIILGDAHMLKDQKKSFRNELAKHSSIKSSSSSSYLPVPSWNNNTMYWPTPNADLNTGLLMDVFNIDEDYVDVLNIEIIKGRNFDRKILTDSTAIILNESAVEEMNLGENPLGKFVYTYKSPTELQPLKIIGVAKNFHYRSLHHQIGELGLRMGNYSQDIIIKTQANQLDQALEHIEKQWSATTGGLPFKYHFFDEKFNNMYKTEQQTGQLFAVLAGLSILIACLGLFGLAAFTAEQKTKEIGVRKVLGASVMQIVMMISKEFGKLVLIAFVIAAPLSWFVMNEWLTTFEFRTEINVSVLLFAGFISALIAWLTMSYHAIKAARTNPAFSLKYE